MALIGPSGAGKSTLLRLLCGWYRADAGSVRINRLDPATLSRRQLRSIRASIGLVHQDLSLVPNLRVAQNVIAGRLGQTSLLRSIADLWRPRRESLREVHALLERVGIGDRLFERTDRLSGGEQQRVAIARAMYQRPSALLADEPVASVDPARARDTVELLTRLGQERRLTLLVSLHNVELAREFFPRLVGMRAGRVAFDAPAGDVDDGAIDELYRIDGAA